MNLHGNAAWAPWTSLCLAEVLGDLAALYVVRDLYFQVSADRLAQASAPTADQSQMPLQVVQHRTPADGVTSQSPGLRGEFAHAGVEECHSWGGGRLQDHGFAKWGGNLETKQEKGGS